MSNRQSTPLSPVWEPWAVVVALECIHLWGFSFEPLALFALANMASCGNQFSCPWKMFEMNTCVMSNQQSTPLSPVWEPWAVIVALECIHLWGFSSKPPDLFTLANMASSGSQFSHPWKMFGMNACVMSNQQSTPLSPIWEPWAVVVALECIHLWGFSF